MAWARIDSGFATHPKLLALTPAQRWVHIAAMCWTAGHGTGGFIPTSALSSLGSNRRTAELLEKFGLWDCCENGWRIHDWDVYNVDSEASKEARDEALVRRKKWREQKRVQRQRERRDSENSADMSAECPQDSLQDVHGILDQTRPDPPSSEEEGVGVRGTSTSAAPEAPPSPSPNGNGTSPLTADQRAEAEALIERMRSGLRDQAHDDPGRRERVELFRAEAQARSIGGGA